MVKVSKFSKTQFSIQDTDCKHHGSSVYILQDTIYISDTDNKHHSSNDYILKDKILYIMQ